jgi:hypothetical protein
MLPRETSSVVASTVVVDMSTPQGHNRQRIVRMAVVHHNCGYPAHELPRNVPPSTV